MRKNYVKYINKNLKILVNYINSLVAFSKKYNISLQNICNKHGTKNNIVNGKVVTSEYGHLNSWIVSHKQFVKKGQIIGFSGNTGHSEGPHCHLTIREGDYIGKPVNPYKYIKF